LDQKDRQRSAAPSAAAVGATQFRPAARRRFRHLSTASRTHRRLDLERSRSPDDADPLAGGRDHDRRDQYEKDPRQESVQAIVEGEVGESRASIARGPSGNPLIA